MVFFGSRETETSVIIEVECPNKINSFEDVSVGHSTSMSSDVFELFRPEEDHSLDRKY